MTQITIDNRIRDALKKFLGEEEYPEILKALRSNAPAFLDELGHFILRYRDEFNVIDRADRYPKSLLCRILGMQADEPLILRDVSATGLKASVNKVNRLTLNDLMHSKIEIVSRRDSFTAVFPVQFVRLADATDKSLELCFRFGELNSHKTIELGTLLDLCEPHQS